ncbi:MAG: FHA domain-containing protein [Gracilibacteraceae bacterium]|jgi:hypothetical protein|nr:FHA domain-containing protein [Gracilibacteraceae bacterium]
MNSAMLECPNGHIYPKRIGTICPYCGAGVNPDGSIAAPRDPSEVETALLYEKIRPACGWLVCISGPRQGLSFTLRQGANFIGRGENNDIRLPGDKLVATNKHAAVSYDPKHRKFTLLPGDAEQIVYLNDDPVYQPTPLYDFNVIALGHTKLLFRPLCGENFSWLDE